MWTGIAALRAKATMAVPPSQQNWLAGVTAPPRAAVMDARFSLGNTASIVAPLRSRATMTGICSAERPRLAALPPLLREARGMPDRLPLKDSRINVSYAFRMNGLADPFWANFGRFLVVLWPPFEKGVRSDLIQIVCKDTATFSENLIKFIQRLEVFIDDGLVGQRP